jgi:hypothetical protein
VIGWTRRIPELPERLAAALARFVMVFDEFQEISASPAAWEGRPSETRRTAG